MSYVVVVDFEHLKNYFVDGGIFSNEDAAKEYALDEYTSWLELSGLEYQYEIVKVNGPRYFELEANRGFEWMSPADEDFYYA